MGHRAVLYRQVKELLLVGFLGMRVATRVAQGGCAAGGGGWFWNVGLHDYLGDGNPVLSSLSAENASVGLYDNFFDCV